jgi:hypothetical protein
MVCKTSLDQQTDLSSALSQSAFQSVPLYQQNPEETTRTRSLLCKDTEKFGAAPILGIKA